MKFRKLFLICAAISCICLSSTACGVKGITGDEWVLKQNDYMDDIDAFSSSMDEVFTLYVTGAITAEDFVNEVDILKTENKIMQAVYEKEKEENPILPDSYSYVAQRGIKGIENARDIFGRILDEVIDENGEPLSPEETAYLYLSYGDEFETSIIEYTVAYEMISGTYNTESETGTNEIIQEEETDNDTDTEFVEY